MNALSIPLSLPPSLVLEVSVVVGWKSFVDFGIGRLGCSSQFEGSDQDDCAEARQQVQHRAFECLSAHSKKGEVSSPERGEGREKRGRVSPAMEASRSYPTETPPTAKLEGKVELKTIPNYASISPFLSKLPQAPLH